ncbi:MAG: TRAP transporter substrate-binding protein [Geminicoccales bacterium]
MFSGKEILTAAALSVGLASAVSAQSITMTYAHSENPSSVTAAIAFEAMIEGKSGGDIQVNRVIHGALGSDRDVVDQLRLGELEFYVVGVHGLNGIAPNFQLFDAPFVFKDRREFYGLMRDKELVGFVNDYLMEASNNGIRFFGAAENSVRNLYTKAGPIRTPADLAPVKLRVPPGPLNIAVWQGLGVGSVVGLSGSERNQGLQTGLIDGVEGSLSGAVGNGHLDILDHVSFTGHSYSYMAYLANNEFYESLSDAHKSILHEAIELSIIVQNGSAMSEEFAAIETLKEKGTNITVLSGEEINAWQAIAYPVGQDFVKENVDPDFTSTVIEALERVRAGLN